ncbi:MAG: cupin domain-containing protein [Xanthomonadales bacterium]|nr:cupin domain-containing protein [Xanthomonadales bacterium]
MTPAIEVTATADLPLGMSAADFLRDYWQKRPLLVRGAIPELAADQPLPIEPDDLAGLACEDFALSRLIVHHADSDSWQVQTGPLPEDAFDGLPERDWTLLVQDVDRWDRDVAGLLRHFDFLPRWRIDDIMVSFAAPGGSVGAHVDQYDVFLIQGMGSRRWLIDDGESPDLTLRDDVELKLLRQFNPTHDWTLEPGDLLYLPPGVPHHGIAIEAGLTFSVGMRAPSQAEMLVDLAEHLAEALAESQRYADPNLAPANDPFEIDGSAIRRARAAMPAIARLPDAILIRWLGGFLTRYRSAGEAAASDAAIRPEQLKTTLQAGGRLSHHPLARFAWSALGDEPLLFVNGLALPCATMQAALICRHDQLGMDELAGQPESIWTTLARLVDSGYLVPDGADHE